MATSPNANPTQITPPYVPLIDPRTGLIDRAWYMFFLSLFNAAQTALVNEDFGPSAGSLSASLEAALDRLTQELRTQPVSVVEQVQPLLDALAQKLDTLPSPQAAELQTRVAAVEQELQTLPRPALGSMAALQQANVPWVTFDETPQSVPPTVGTVAWDGGTTLGVQATTNVLIRVGESEYIYAKASAAITKGQVCYHTGAVGSSGVITAAPTPLALADPNQIVGVAAETIALNGFGLIQISGDLRGFNTTGASVGEVWADGDALYYNPAFVGSFTKVKPSAPNQKTYMGEVINAGGGGSGSIHVRIVQGTVLGGTDANVQFGTLNNGDLIQYDSALQYWKNVAPSAVSVSTATNLAGGATGSVPYQSATSTTTFLPIGTAAQVMKVNAGATAPEWVSGAALTKVDDTNVTLTLGGTPATSLLAATSLTLGWTGQLAVSRGGTGLSSGTSGGIPYFSSTTAMTSSALLAANALMVGGGAGAAPSTITTGTGVVTALGVNTGTAGAFVVNGGALGTPLSGTVTNLTGTASININGTVGATTPNTGAFTTLTTTGNSLVGTTSPGADGLGILSGLNLSFSEGAGASYANVFRQSSSAATIIANGYKYSATAGGFASSTGVSWAKTAIGLGVGTSAITFYTDSASAVANGTDVTPTERMRLNTVGLGLGTASPSVLLDVQNGNATINRASNSTILLLGGSPSANWEGDIQLVTSNSAINWRISTNRVGSGWFTITPSTAGGGSTFTTPAFTITETKSVVAGTQAALATNATNGFLYVPTCAGTPTGTPTAITGMAPMVIDTTNNKLYFYSGGTWRDAGP
jgi:hypothetical protein